MGEWLIAFGLVLVIEGMLWFLSPRTMKTILYQALHAPDSVLRFLGLTAMLSGLLVVYLARG